MKNHLFRKTLLIALLSTTLLGCKKVVESAVNCIGESLLVSVHHSAATDNSKKINFTVNYSGSFTVSAIKIEYGDGSSETISGNTSSHTYQAAGTYKAKISVTLKKNKSTCESYPERNITVN